MWALPHLEDSTLQLSQLLARWVIQLTWVGCLVPPVTKIQSPGWPIGCTGSTGPFQCPSFGEEQPGWHHGHTTLLLDPSLQHPPVDVYIKNIHMVHPIAPWLVVQQGRQLHEGGRPCLQPPHHNLLSESQDHSRRNLFRTVETTKLYLACYGAVDQTRVEGAKGPITKA